MSDILDPLVVGRVVGDVLDPFIRSITLRVLYHPNRTVVNAAGLRPSEISSRPRAWAGGELRTFFTLVRPALPFADEHVIMWKRLRIYSLILCFKLLVDPDAPSPSNPTQREYLHWLVVNIPGSTDASFGNEKVSYGAPNPTAGIHRLVFVLFRQPNRQTVRAPADRMNFNTREFAEQNGLGRPVAAVYFNCQRENGAGGRRFM